MNILFHTFPIGWLHYLPLAFFPSTSVQHCNIFNDNRLTFFLNSSIQCKLPKLSNILEWWYFTRVLWKASFSCCWEEKFTSIKIQRSPPHRIYSKYRAWSEHGTATETPIFLATEQVRNIGQLTYSPCTLAIPMQSRDNNTSSLQTKCWRHKNS